MRFVLDNSITMRWLLNDRDVETMEYARRILQLLTDGATAVVPNLWALEAANVTAKAIKKGIISQADASKFLALVRELDIQPDMHTHERALGETLNLARQHNLSSYDASYLELALRTGFPIATVDRDPCEAATRAGALRALLS